mgnify:CR=1 FL=1
MQLKRTPAFLLRLTYIAVGVALLAGAVAIFSRPQDALGAMAFVLGLMALARGIAHVVGFLRSKSAAGWKLRLLLALGVLLIILGIFLLLWPQLVGSLMVWAVALWFIIEALRSFTWQKELKRLNPSAAAISLVLNVLLLVMGVLMLLNPLPTLLTIPLLVGMALVLAGLDMILTGLFLPRGA